MQLVFDLWPEFAVDLETLLIRASTASLILTVLAAVDPVIDFIERHVERD